MTKNKKSTIDEISNVEIEKKISIGQDFIDEKLIYGVKFNDKSYLLTSDREFIRLEECKEKLKVIPRHQEVEMSNITPSTVRNFINNNLDEYLNADKLFEELRDYFKKYVFFEDNTNYDVLSLWIMVTYCYTIFTHIPYIHLKGDKGVGKSTLLTILKNICFNATMWSSMTEAVIFRYIDVSNATLLLDEAEDLKNPRNKGINGILNAGFNREGMVPRTMMAKNSEKVIQYNAFSMKAIAGINDIPNVLRDRCININMSKKPKELKLGKLINTEEIMLINEKIKQNLYIFALLNCKNIYEIYKKIHNEMPECMSSRDVDIYMPIYSVAKLIDNCSNRFHLQETLDEYVKKMSAIRSRQDIEDNLSYKLIVDLYDMIQENKVKPYKYIYFLNTEVIKYLENKEYYFKSLKSLTQSLETLQIENTRIKIDSEKKTFYIITKNHLLKLINSYNIVLPKVINGEDIKSEDLIFN